MTAAPQTQGFPFAEAVGFTINQLMFQTGTTRKELAEVLDVTPPAISQRVRGRISWPTEDLMIVADYLGVQFTDLLPQPVGALTDRTYMPAQVIPGAANKRSPGVSAEGPPSARPKGLEPPTF